MMKHYKQCIIELKRFGSSSESWLQKIYKRSINENNKQKIEMFLDNC